MDLLIVSSSDGNFLTMYVLFSLLHERNFMLRLVDAVDIIDIPQYDIRVLLQINY